MRLAPVTQGEQLSDSSSVQINVAGKNTLVCLVCTHKQKSNSFYFHACSIARPHHQTIYNNVSIYSTGPSPTSACYRHWIVSSVNYRASDCWSRISIFNIRVVLGLLCYQFFLTLVTFTKKAGSNGFLLHSWTSAGQLHKRCQAERTLALLCMHIFLF